MAIVEPYVKSSERIREYPNLLNLDGVTNIGGVVVSPKGKSIQYISGPKDFLEKLVGAEELPRNSHISLINAYYCSYFAGLVIARSMNTEQLSGAYISLDEDGSSAVKSIKLLNGSILNASKTLTISIPNGDSGTSNFGLLINNTLFYYGTDNIYNLKIVPNIPGSESANAVLTNSISDIVNSINSWGGYSAYIKSETEIVINYTTNGLTGTEASDLLTIKGSYVEDTENNPDWAPDLSEITGPDGLGSLIEMPESYMLFSATEPGSVNNVKLEFTKVAGDNVYKMSALVDNKYTYYVVSPNSVAVDQSGNNCYIENINDLVSGFNVTIQIKEGDAEAQSRLDSLDLSKVVINLGNSGLDLIASQDASYFSKAVYKLGEQKEFSIAYLSDFGVTNLSYLKDYIYVGANNYWFTPVDIPYNYTNSAAIEYFGNNVSKSLGTNGMAASNVIIAGPFDRNTGFTGWISKIAWSSLYYERVFTNKANRKEFAPCYEQTNGVLNYSNPYTLLGDSDRVNLLNASNGPINYVVYDQANNQYYLNDNRTHQTENNIMSEEMNRRMINQITRDVKKIMNRFKGQTNTSSTRANVESLITIYFNNNIMNQDYKPLDFNPICDTSNNTDEIISANKLALTVQIKLANSIKFIDIINDIYPLGVDFEA